MVDFLEKLAAAAGGAVLLAGIAWVLIKRLIDHQLAKTLEGVKSELTQRTEALKTDLSIHAHQHTVALSRVDSRRAEAIHRIHASMREWQRALERLIADTNEFEPTPGDVYFHAREETGKAHAAGEQFTRTLADEALYLDAATYERALLSTQVGIAAVEELQEHILAAHHYNAEEEALDDIEQKRKELAVLMRREVTPGLDDLLLIFRRILRSE